MNDSDLPRGIPIERQIDPERESCLDQLSMTPVTTLGAPAEGKAEKVEDVDTNLDRAKTDAERERWRTTPRLCDDAIRAEAKSQLQSLRKELAELERSGAQGEVCGAFYGHVGVGDGCVCAGGRECCSERVGYEDGICN